jgi:preprotein translocase subunit YajC
MSAISRPLRTRNAPDTYAPDPFEKGTRVREAGGKVGEITKVDKKAKAGTATGFIYRYDIKFNDGTVTTRNHGEVAQMVFNHPGMPKRVKAQSTSDTTSKVRKKKRPTTTNDRAPSPKKACLVVSAS